MRVSISEEIELEAGDAPCPRRQSRVAQPHRRSACDSTQDHRRRESRHGDDLRAADARRCGLGPAPALRAVSGAIYNGQGLHLRPSLARSTISQSRDTKCKVDQGREIAKIGAALFCEGNQAIAPVSSEFGGERWPWSLWSGRIESPRPRLAEQGQGDLLHGRPAEQPPAGRPPHGRSGQSSPLGEAS